MNPLSLYGLTSVLCFGLPVLVIVLFRLYRHTSLIALALYYLLTIARCLGAPSIPPVPDFDNPLEVAYTYLEIPLLFTALLFFCPSRQRQLGLQSMVFFFVAYEAAVSLFAGFAPVACAYIMAPGLLMVVLYSGWLLLRQLRFTLLYGKNAGRVLMLGSVVFAHAAYLYVFYRYFLGANKDITTVYHLYFVASTLASLLMAVGLFMMRHRIRELQELKITRKELQAVFGG